MAGLGIDIWKGMLWVLRVCVYRPWFLMFAKMDAKTCASPPPNTHINKEYKQLLYN